MSPGGMHEPCLTLPGEVAVLEEVKALGQVAGGLSQLRARLQQLARHAFPTSQGSPQDRLFAEVVLALAGLWEHGINVVSMVPVPVPKPKLLHRVTHGTCIPLAQFKQLTAPRDWLQRLVQQRTDGLVTMGLRGKKGYEYQVFTLDLAILISAFCAKTLAGEAAQMVDAANPSGGQDQQQQQRAG